MSRHLLVVTRATPEIADLRNQAHLWDSLGLAWPRKHVADFRARTFLGRMVDVRAKEVTGLVLERSHISADDRRRE